MDFEHIVSQTLNLLRTAPEELIQLFKLKRNHSQTLFSVDCIRDEFLILLGVSSPLKIKQSQKEDLLNQSLESAALIAVNDLNNDLITLMELIALDLVLHKKHESLRVIGLRSVEHIDQKEGKQISGITLVRETRLNYFVGRVNFDSIYLRDCVL